MDWLQNFYCFISIKEGFFYFRIFFLPLWNSGVIEQWLLHNRNRIDEKGNAAEDKKKVEFSSIPFENNICIYSL